MAHGAARAAAHPRHRRRPQPLRRRRAGRDHRARGRDARAHGQGDAQHRRPEALYLDNGPTYTGDVLATLCARLEIGLLHAQAEDPEARGEMERFWRTLRDGLLHHIGTPGSLHDVQVRLLAFLAKHYTSRRMPR